MNVCIVGLGYVGYPLAEQCVSKGLHTVGLDLDHNKIDAISQGIHPIDGGPAQENFPAETENEVFIKEADVIIICVPTPVNEKKIPDLDPVKGACQTIINAMRGEGQLVILESTINPGVMEGVVRPLFEAAGYEIGSDVYLAHCPERINPGDPTWNVANIPRVLGAFTKQGLEKAYEFYTTILDAPITKMSTIRTAEACKIIENAFRDINIAYVNELAKSFDILDIDVVEVIKGASTKPFAFMAHYPSCGVGGHCIPVDPYYLIEEAKNKGFDHKFLRIAREINNSMPAYTTEKLADALNEHKKAINGTRIGVLGLSYKADVGDDRESPSFEVIKLLKKKGAIIKTYDPYLDSDYETLEAFQKENDIIVLCTNHKEFSQLNLNKVTVLVDGKNMFYGQHVPCTYRGIGRK